MQPPFAPVRNGGTDNVSGMRVDLRFGALASLPGRTEPTRLPNQRRKNTTSPIIPITNAPQWWDQGDFTENKFAWMKIRISIKLAATPHALVEGFPLTTVHQAMPVMAATTTGNNTGMGDDVSHHFSRGNAPFADFSDLSKTSLSGGGIRDELSACLSNFRVGMLCKTPR